MEGSGGHQMETSQINGFKTNKSERLELMEIDSGDLSRKYCIPPEARGSLPQPKTDLFF